MLSPANSTTCTVEELEFLTLAESVDKTLSRLDRSEREILAQRYELLSNVASYNGLLLGVSNTAWSNHTKQVELILKDLERTYVNSYNSTGNLNNKNFFTQRKITFQRLNNALLRFGQPDMGGRLLTGDVRTNLGLCSKSIVHQWNKLPGDATSIPNFTKNYETVAKMSRNLKRVGYVGIALTGINAAANIQKACTVEDSTSCSKSKYTQTGMAGGSIVGAGLGGYAVTWGVCSTVFSLPTVGTSTLWCGILAGSAGGILGGSIGGKYGEDLGDIVYQTTNNL